LLPSNHNSGGQEEARIHYFNAVVAEATRLDPSGAFDGKAFISGSGGVGPILAETSCKFLFPATYPDVLLMGATTAEPTTTATAAEAHPRSLAIGTDRFTLHHAAWSLRHGRLVSKGSGTIVSVDYAAGGARCALPPELDAAIRSLEGQCGEAGGGGAGEGQGCGGLLPALEAIRASGDFDQA
jgi:acyl-CoA thioesterase FadM